MSKGKINIYTCPGCHGETVTIDRDEGVTPFFLRCRCTDGCAALAQSACYRPRHGHGPPAWEWYAPDAEERAKAGPAMRDHAEMGGLFIRRIDAVSSGGTSGPSGER